MHTELAEFLINTPEGQEAKDIVGRCVHCGFCKCLEEGGNPRILRKLGLVASGSDKRL